MPAASATLGQRFKQAKGRLRGARSGGPRRAPGAAAVALRELPTLWVPACAGIAAGGSALEPWYWAPLALATVLAHLAQSALRGRYAPTAALPSQSDSSSFSARGEGELGASPSEGFGGPLGAKAWRLAATHSVLFGVVLLLMVRRRLVSSAWPIAASAAGFLVALWLTRRRASWAWGGLSLRAAFVVAGALMARSPMLSGVLWLLGLLLAHALALRAGLWVASARRGVESRGPRVRARGAVAVLALALAASAAFAMLEVRGGAALALGATYALFVGRALVEVLRHGRVDLWSWAPGLCVVEAWVLSALGYPGFGLAGLLSAALSWLLLSRWAGSRAAAAGGLGLG